jgi:hypothetical protein
MSNSRELPPYQRVLLTTAVALVFIWIVWLIFFKMMQKESAFSFPGEDDGIDPDTTDDVAEDTLEDVPSLLNLEYRVSTRGRKAVFPMAIEKTTPGPIELPNRRSLLNKDAAYKFIDVMPGDRITILSKQRLSYTVDHQAFTDVFLVTDKDFLIAVSQAKEHFKLVT